MYVALSTQAPIGVIPHRTGLDPFDAASSGSCTGTGGRRTPVAQGSWWSVPLKMMDWLVSVRVDRPSYIGVKESRW
jgi:hypothetical protein